MGEQDTIAVIGAGVIGAAAAFALAREGRRVLLLDRAEPGVAGASFGNAGHIAAEMVQPLPSPATAVWILSRAVPIRRRARLVAAAGAAHGALDRQICGRRISAHRKHASFGAAGAPLRRGLGALGRGHRPTGAAQARTDTTRLRWGRRAAAHAFLCGRIGADRGQDPPGARRSNCCRCSAAQMPRRRRACGSRTQPTSSIPWRPCARWWPRR